MVSTLSSIAGVSRSETEELSPAFQGWVAGPNERESRRDDRPFLPEHESRIVCYLRSLHQRQILLLEGPFRMMLRLAVDVSITVFFCDWLTLKAPYPCCHANLG